MRALFLAAATLLAACTTATPAPTAAPLPSGEWRLVDGGARPPTIAFQTEGEAERAAGFAGCNRWFGAVTRSDAGAVSLSAIGATRMACMEGDTMQREAAFLEQLGRVTAVREDAGALVLSDASGTAVLRFTR